MPAPACGQHQHREAAAVAAPALDHAQPVQPGQAQVDDGRLQGGFFRGQPQRASDSGAPLLVLYADALAPVEAAVRDAGGEIVRPVFSFPGGSRFQFVEPGGNELAVWSERDPA